ncbi:MAG: SH3 domain-containing protein [Emcibacteraceae bacterium]|nr:SH3 domain-containing protein [Emcibacteraceae bacterium]
MMNLKKLPLLLFMLVIPFSSHAQEAEKGTMGASGHPLPRFMSLVNDKTNMRTGPGIEYPIDWIYLKEDYPLKVTAEYGNWRKIVDVDGSTGWILRSLLSLKRYGLITGGTQDLYKSPQNRRQITVSAEQDVIGTIRKCADNWCEMELGGFSGWINNENIWGALNQESFD